MLTKHCKSALVISGVLSTLLLTGCKDDSLDLDNIDTTIALQVKELELPINVAPITFGDMVDLTSEECIDTINGEYVLIKEGTFTSDEIKIRDIETHATLDFEQPQPVPIIASKIKNVPLGGSHFPFYYEKDNVDEYIRAIYSGEIDVTLTLKIEAKAAKGGALPSTFTDMVFEVPRGFYGDVTVIGEKTYNEEIKQPKNESENVIAEIAVPDMGPDSNGDYTFIFDVKSFIFNNINVENDENYKAYLSEDHTFYLRTAFGIKSGDVVFSDDLQDNGTLSTSFHVSELALKKFSGNIWYDVKELNPEVVDLGDLPKELTNDSTKISLKNPQLYVTINNPLGYAGVSASTGLIIKQVRDNGENEIEASMPKKLEIAATTGEQSFCLSQDSVKSYYDKYPGLTDKDWYKITNFGNIIYGEGLPQGLKIDFDEPKMNPSNVYDFEIGSNVNLGVVSGKYTLFAPLDFGGTEGSILIYEDEQTGWDLNGSDDNSIEIKHLSLTADCVSDLPVDLTITFEPLNKEGKPIDNISGEAKVRADANGGKDGRINIDLDGNMVDLDGIRYKVTIVADKDKGAALKPSMSLKLENVKVKVTGSYIIKNND